MLLTILGLMASSARAWEADVHYGLTLWLARQAGFMESQARTVAAGNQRVDAGDIQYTTVLFDYGCTGRDSAAFQRAGQAHFPSDRNNWASPMDRKVTASGAAARAPVEKALRIASAGKAPVALQLFGEALHTMQDAWAHQGVPDSPAPGLLPFICDPARVWAAPAARGGWNSHRADQTWPWRQDVLAMAEETYAALNAYPELGAKRTPLPWKTLEASVGAFASAATKQEKASWFAENGVAEAGFLQYLSLKDGGLPALSGERFSVGRVLRFPSHQARQPHVDTGLLDLLEAFFSDWMRTADFTALARRYGTPDRNGNNELAARLAAWRFNDHGSVAEELHGGKPLTEGRRRRIARLAAAPGALARYASSSDALVPLLPDTGMSEVSPLLHFIVRSRDGSDSATAVAKLRHLPYDSLAVIAARVNGVWRVVDVVAAVDP